MNMPNKKLGPIGANIFIFHIPNDLKETELHKLFIKFGEITSIRVLT